MESDSWKVLAHALITIIGMAPAVIAAVSSLRNGRTLKRNGQTPSPQQPAISKNGVPDEWEYKPPDLF